MFHPENRCFGSIFVQKNTRRLLKTEFMEFYRLMGTTLREKKRQKIMEPEMSNVYSIKLVKLINASELCTARQKRNADRNKLVFPAEKGCDKLEINYTKFILSLLYSLVDSNTINGNHSDIG